MKKLTQSSKQYQRMRSRYQEKRLSDEWKERKKRKRLFKEGKKIKQRKQKRKPHLVLSAPKNFSLIQNTEEVLAYFDLAKKHTHADDNITFDISDVENLTPESVALLVASINNSDFIKDAQINGNAPKKSELRKLFTESGFYDFVQANRKFAKGNDSLLHKETYQKVKPEVAQKAAMRGAKHVFGDANADLGIIFDTLIECMSNTKNHADLIPEGSCFWWLYVYNDPKQSLTKYIFLDLGVGIFKSAAVQGFIKKMTKGTMLYPNIKIVDDLLAGKIKSRAKIDTDIRGKGIPQIVAIAKNRYFRSFYILANDIKVDLKTGAKTQIKHPLNGTMLYWELENT